MPMPLNPARLALAAMLGTALAGPAHAALGGDVASVMRDSAALKATHSVTPFARYDLHESSSPDGMLLREYVDHGGRVFAVSWRGPRSPDLKELLGVHAAHFAAARSRLSNHHVTVVDEPGLAVTVLKLPRGWSGQALVPTALPSGVDRAELR
jgi:hypothetical protein